MDKISSIINKEICKDLEKMEECVEELEKINKKLKEEE